jgi:hypothetical protein
MVQRVDTPPSMLTATDDGYSHILIGLYSSQVDRALIHVVTGRQQRAVFR